MPCLGSAWFGAGVMAGMGFSTASIGSEEYGFPERFDDVALETKADELYQSRGGVEYHVGRSGYRAIPLVVESFSLRLLRADRSGSNFIWQYGVEYFTKIGN